jgi:hypothetical protein
MDMLTKAAECMQKQIVRYISFVKSIPGWENVHNIDKCVLDTTLCEEVCQ